MSYLKSCLTIATILGHCSLLLAQDQNITWVTTAFWTAPQIRELHPTVTPMDSATLSKSCLEYKRRIETLTLPGEEDMVVRYRSSDAFSEDGSFKASFKISALEEHYQMNASFVVDSAIEKLPLYTQSEATTYANIDDKTLYLVQPKAGSYTALSRSLKIVDSEFELEFQGENPILTVYGKDLACDMVAGNVLIEMATSAFVKIEDQKYEPLKLFYLNKIQPDLSLITGPASKDSQIIKSARLGFRLGNHLSTLTGAESLIIEKQIENMMNTLFVPGTLKNSPYVLDSVDGKKKEIQIVSSTEGKPVKIVLKFQK